MPRGPRFDPQNADEIGLVAVGGDLRPERLLEAYRSGVFPWFGPEDPLLWWSPDPRGILELAELHIPRRLLRTLRSGRFRHTINRAFGEVIRGCADRPGDGCWITPAMIDAYEELHARGHAHSLEVWAGDKLAGGIYGVAVGGLFAGESMFTRRRDASKVALVRLVEHLRQRGFQLFDIQFVSDHTARFGARAIPRDEYLVRLRAALRHEVSFV
ncbi:MAG TPA: leucyl/phenylalanyl-tRNA--protein transferase [Gemmataceae bacterium]|nr:leucyl/phenylalanyl-tRNA--protein transferase [Gemmataceae bacterium]